MIVIVKAYYIGAACPSHWTTRQWVQNLKTWPLNVPVRHIDKFIDVKNYRTLSPVLRSANSFTTKVEWWNLKHLGLFLF